MVFIIDNNSQARFISRNLGQVEREKTTAVERIASGKRINSARDDASGLAIAQRMTSMLGGMYSARRNANDAISMMQTADGSLGSVSDNLQRMRELAIQASNGSLNDDDRRYLNSEFNALKEEVGRVIDTSKFNGINLLSQNDEVTFQVGANEGETIGVELTDMNSQLNDAGLNSATIDSAAGAESAISAIDDALNSINETRAEYGAVQNRFESTINNLDSSIIETAESRSRVEDSDIAKEMSSFVQQQIREQASIAMLGQANQHRGLVMKLLGM